MRPFGTLVALIIFATSLEANAEVRLSKVQAFLKKNGTCYFAVGFYNASAPASKDPDLAEDVFCAMDSVIAEGTVNEKAGCGLMMFNVETGAIRKATFDLMMPTSMVSPLIVEGKKCKNGGFETLLESKWFNDSPKAKELLFNGPMKGTAKTIVAYSESDRASNIYNAAVAGIEAEQKASELAEAKHERAEEERQRLKNETDKKASEERLSRIEGSWNQPCYKEEGQFATSSTRFEAGKITQSVIMYLDDACFRKAATFGTAGSYKVGPKLQRPDGAQAIDITFYKITLKPNSNEVAANFTGQMLHGIISWSSGEEQDISNSDLGKKTIRKTSYTYFVLNGKRMFMPKSDDLFKTGPVTRSSVEVDKSRPYLRR